jgi:hypothetical protein
MKKVLIQSKEQLDLVKEEIHVWTLFNHPNLLPLLDHAIIEVKVINFQFCIAFFELWNDIGYAFFYLRRDMRYCDTRLLASCKICQIRQKVILHLCSINIVRIQQPSLLIPSKLG